MTESQIKTKARNGASTRDGRNSPVPYDAPRLIRVRVETARLVAGLEHSDTHCTKHYHDSVGCDP